VARLKIVFVRHGPTSLHTSSPNRTGKVRGWQDVPLSAEGVREVRALASELKTIPMRGLYSSDLDRSEHSMRIIAKETGVPILGSMRGLRTWNMGDLEGKLASACRAIIRDHINNPDKPVAGGESLNTFKERALSALQQLRERHPGETIGIVSHHRVERLLAGWKATGGGIDWNIDPAVFMQDGIPPADYVVRVLAEAAAEDDDHDVEVDDDADDGDEAEEAREPRPASRKSKPAKPSQSSRRPAPAVQWNARQILPQQDGPGKGLWSRSVGGPDDGTGVKSDPIDLKPAVPIRKRSVSWNASVRGSLLER